MIIFSAPHLGGSTYEDIAPVDNQLPLINETGEKKPTINRQRRRDQIYPKLIC
jgi:hypothetical protein